MGYKHHTLIPHDCRHCGKPLVRKQFKNQKEATAAFNIRKFCDQLCFGLWEKGKPKHVQKYKHPPSSPEPAKIIPIPIPTVLALPAPAHSTIDLSQSTVDPFHFLFVISRVAFKLHPSDHSSYLENLAIQLKISNEDKEHIFAMANKYNLQRCNDQLLDDERIRHQKEKASKSFAITYGDCNPDDNTNSEFNPNTDANPAPTHADTHADSNRTHANT